jgi:hypothetical protein
MSNSRQKAPAGMTWVFTPVIRLRTGKVLYAKDYGKKAFVFLAKQRKR